MVKLDNFDKVFIVVYCLCLIIPVIAGGILISKGDIVNSAYAFSVTLCLIISGLVMCCFFKFDSMLAKRIESTVRVFRLQRNGY